MVKPLFIFFAFIICFDQHIEQEMLLSYPSVRYFWGERLSPVESSISAPILFRRTASCLKGFRTPPQHHEIAEGEGILVEGAEKQQQQTENKKPDHPGYWDRGLQQHAAIPSHSQPRWSRQSTLGRAHQKPGSLCRPMCQDQGLQLIQKKREYQSSVLGKQS